MKFKKHLSGVIAGLCITLGYQASAQAATCVYNITNEWNTGLTGTITITNNSSSAINGWSVNWTYSTNKITNYWNANVTGSNPYSAAALSWNSNISPNQSVSFGFQVDKNGGTAEKPVVTGSVCNSVSSQSSSSRSSSLSSSSRSSSISSSSRSNSVSSISSSRSSSPSSSSRSSSLSSSSRSSSSSLSSSSRSSSSSSSSSTGTTACVMPKADTNWQTTNSCQTTATSCTAGTWMAPRDGGENGAPLRLESAHFAIYWKDGTNITMAAAQNAANTLENIWSKYFGAPMFFPEPYCNSSQKWKAAVHFDNEFPLWGGGWSRNGINYMGMWIGPGAASDSWGLAHEFMHGVQSTTAAFAGSGTSANWIWESHANWAPHQIFNTNVHCSEMLPNMPHLYYGNMRNRYCNWQFFEYLKDKHCPAAVNNIWAYQAPAGQRDPWQKLMLSQNWSIEQLNDRFGDWAMHNITWDYKNLDGSDQGAVYRQNYGSTDASAGSYTQRRLRLTQLESLDSSWAQNRRFVSPYYWAPQRWGYNVIQLFPESGATSVKVSFRGITQSGANSGWRWGLVSTNSAMTQSTYSELKSGADGELTHCITAGEKLFLVVVATPTQYQQINPESVSDGKPYGSIYRYPYMIQLSGAWPQGFQNGQIAACPSGTVRHSNGGGCAVSGTPSSVYVGPYAKIIGGNVSGNARIEDQATIVNGNVLGGTVGAMSLIGVASNPHHGASSFMVSDSAQVRSTFYPMGWFGNSQSATGTANLVGDLEYYSTNKSMNTFYGLVDDNWNGVTSSPEVTVKPPYVWRP